MVAECCSSIAGTGRVRSRAAAGKARKREEGRVKRQAEIGCPSPRCRGAMSQQEHDFYKCPDCGGEFWPLDRQERQTEYGDPARPLARCPGPECQGTLLAHDGGDRFLVCNECGAQFWPSQALEDPVTRAQVIQIMREEARRGSGKGGNDSTGRAKKPKKGRAPERPWTLA